jgi:hypothetical protein
VLVLPSHCTGAVVETRWLVATAKHCIDDGARLRVRVGGVERDAELVDEDAAADQVLLALASDVPVEPLGVVRRIPIVGTVLYFHGNPERPRWQAARLDKIAPPVAAGLRGRSIRASTAARRLGARRGPGGRSSGSCTGCEVPIATPGDRLLGSSIVCRSANTRGPARAHRLGRRLARPQ